MHGSVERRVAARRPAAVLLVYSRPKGMRAPLSQAISFPKTAEVASFGFPTDRLIVDQLAIGYLRPLAVMLKALP